MSVLCLRLCRNRGFWSHLTRTLQIHSQSIRCLEETKFQTSFSKNSFCSKTPIRDHKVLSAISHGVPPGSVQGPFGLRFHTSSHNRALPAPLIWMLLKPLQKITAIILGRSIRKWWVALPDNRRQLLREWAWHRRWQLSAVTGATLVIIVLLLLTHLDDTPVTGRTRLLVFSKENFTKLAEVTSEAYMQEFEQLLIPAKDPRHQVVERVVQHLSQRNKDFPGIADVSWTVHVVQSPEINAFVLPNGKVFMFTGMLEAVADIHQLTIILGHEMAHALLGHSAEQASLSHILDLLSILLLTAIWAVCPRDSLALLGQWAQGRLTELIFNRPYSRKLEAEADQVGLQLAAKACADVRSGPVFWQQMEIQDQLRGDPTVPEWLSTHPSHRNRVSQLERLIPQALELRESCVCPALPAADPRLIFSKRVQALLETSKEPKGEGLQKVMSLHQEPAGLSAAPNNPNMLPVEASKRVNVTVE
ncbi:metalloendopeptidase OMA1, mitochondrial [Synchiropus splendidus]|uniref:metalloendopeptidase OMA1, mitochondrial n=1 Tax=Synchiropus splendidus TaxID=270530 RepID=UPI00237E37CF|nr:metalloendopeptidase OMA1, mitochondrial [Synchiropus splendidus]